MDKDRIFLMTGVTFKKPTNCYVCGEEMKDGCDVHVDYLTQNVAHAHHADKAVTK